MKQIDTLYANDFGMAFYWKKDSRVLDDKIQLVFKETGFYFSLFEMRVFAERIRESRERNVCCNDCENRRQCVKFLLKTPCKQIDLAVSVSELNLIEDLVAGTLFRIALERYINNVGRN